MTYDIIATLGPSSQTDRIWQFMINAGATAFRLNTSHLSMEQLGDWLTRLQSFYRWLSPKPKLILDLQGSKWRLGQFESFELYENHPVVLEFCEATEKPNVLPVPHQDFFKAASLSNGEIRLNDARALLQIESLTTSMIVAKVTQSGIVESRKGITFQNSDFRHESLSEKDESIVAQTRDLPFIQYAISYIKDTDEMAGYRQMIGKEHYLIAKLERDSAMADVKGIAEISNELWLCRGDLGAELGMAEMASMIHPFSACIRSFTKPVMLAGQVLEHMVRTAAPSRSEICYLHDALMAGYAGVILSDETATGDFPVESCRMAAMFRG